MSNKVTKSVEEGKMSKVKNHTVDELEELIIYSKSPLTRMLALQKLTKQYYSEEVGNKLSEIQEILNR
jgi:hypothetical protein